MIVVQPQKTQQTLHRQAMGMDLLDCDHTLSWQGLSPPSPSIPGGIRFHEAVPHLPAAARGRK